MEGLCEHLRNTPKVIIAQTSDAEHLPSVFGVVLGGWIPLMSILTAVRKLCGGWECQSQLWTRDFPML